MFQQKWISWWGHYSVGEDALLAIRWLDLFIKCVLAWLFPNQQVVYNCGIIWWVPTCVLGWIPKYIFVGSCGHFSQIGSWLINFFRACSRHNFPLLYLKHCWWATSISSRRNFTTGVPCPLGIALGIKSIKPMKFRRSNSTTKMDRSTMIASEVFRNI